MGVIVAERNALLKIAQDFEDDPLVRDQLIFEINRAPLVHSANPRLVRFDTDNWAPSRRIGELFKAALVALKLEGKNDSNHAARHE